MKTGTKLTVLALAAVAILALTGCSDDDDPATPQMTGKTFTVTVANISTVFDHFGSGAFTTPVGAAGPAPIFPGEAYEMSFGAAPGHRLSFATMMVQSNDLFYAPDGNGIALYNGTTPVTGDVTAQLMLWDAGTEANEEPGLGANQAPRQAGADTGPADGDTTVRLVNDGYTYPAVADVIEATLTYDGGGMFTLRIENVSDSSTLMPSSGPSLPVPLAPGVFVVHATADPLFTAGMADAGLGLEAIAEDGDPAALAAVLAANSGLVSPLAPVAWAVHAAGMPIFTAGLADAGLGLEHAAEDGDPAMLVASLAGLPLVAASGAAAVPVGAGAAGPAFPGNMYTFTFDAEPGDFLSFASMLGQTNDLFFGFGEAGLALFDANDRPVTGDVSAQVMLWDAGTEANQWPGAGADQAPRQAAPDTGADDPTNMVRLVNDGFPYPATGTMVQVMITAE
ncbi:spondin domain-containing protein [bacterium]|nr:spondin domain-containing protein [bacterium]